MQITWSNESTCLDDRASEAFPLGRMGDAENDIGRAVVALVSDGMKYMTGQTVMLTGGA
ncbi:MAG: SDR family oxidoreductase [Mycobacterium sp.]|nr:MAG: SDR family oxidoreductase [Mycobacterium sp.]